MLRKRILFRCTLLISRALKLHVIRARRYRRLFTIFPRSRAIEVRTKCISTKERALSWVSVVFLLILQRYRRKLRDISRENDENRLPFPWGSFRALFRQVGVAYRNVHSFSSLLPFPGSWIRVSKQFSRYPAKNIRVIRPFVDETISRKIN